MLKTVSSVINVIGALNYKGTWNANTNTPTIVSSVGVKGDYYVVSVGGATVIDGISNWGVGDWIVFDGAAWQRVEGGPDLNGVNLSVSGTTTLSGLTASTALALDASKNVTSVTNTGTGNNVLATSPSIATPTLTGDVQLSTGNIVQGTATKGVNFTANTPAAGMTSQLLNWYEEGTWTPTIIGSSTAGTGTYSLQEGTYTRIGRQVTVTAAITWSAHTGSGVLRVSGLPFTIKNDNVYAAFALEYADLTVSANAIACIVTRPGQTYLQVDETVAGGTGQSGVTLDTAASLYFSVTYFV